MVSLNDVLLAYSNIPVDDPIAEIWGRGLQGGYEIIKYTGTLPITITADGSALIDYHIYGNTVQNGTPTPENPIMPEGVGERTENLFDWKKTKLNTGITWATGEEIQIDGRSLSDYIPVEEAEYTTNVAVFFIFYDEQKKYVGCYDGSAFVKNSGMALSNISIPYTGYLRILVFGTVDLLKIFTFTKGSTPLETYEPYGYKLPMVSRTENLFDISEITECSVGTISRNGIEYTDIGYYTITAFGALNGWCYVRVLNGKNIVRTEHFIVPGQLTPVKINLSVGQRLVIYDANAGSVESTKRLFEQWKPVILYSDSSQPEYPSSYIPYGSTVTNIYLGEAETTRRIKKLVLTGEEGITQHSIVNNIVGVCIPIPTVVAAGSPVICTHATNVSWANYYGFRTYAMVASNVSAGNLIIYMSAPDSEHNTLSDIKSYLAAQYAAGTPVTVWYVLAEPETGIVNEPLMKIGDYADTLSMEQADVSIPTLAGTTVIDYDGTPKPSQMYIKYRR